MGTSSQGVQGKNILIISQVKKIEGSLHLRKNTALFSLVSN